MSFRAAVGSEIISRDATVTSSDPLPIIGELDQVTDGDKSGSEGSYVELTCGKQWVQIDLGETSEIWAILVWRRFGYYFVINDIIVQVSNDPSFTTSITVFNNDHDNSSGMGNGNDPAYYETNHGRIIKTNGIRARYIRLYSNGYDSSPVRTNHYTEVEVWGKPRPGLFSKLKNLFIERSMFALDQGQHPQP